LEKPVLYVASDTPQAAGDFAEFSPWNASRLGVDIPGADFLIDHHILRHADHLAISNSTFSFTAAMLNERAESFLRPNPNLRELVPFDPWAAEVLWDAAVDANEISGPERMLVQEQIRPTDVLVYVGAHCSPWTNFARSAHPDLRIFEVEAGISLDRIRRDRGLKQVRLLILENAKAASDVLSGAPQTLAEACLEMILLRWESHHDFPAVSSMFFDAGFVLFHLREHLVERVEPDGPLRAGSYLAMRRGLIPPFPEITRAVS
jgi:hypothetical protein